MNDYSHSEFIRSDSLYLCHYDDQVPFNMNLMYFMQRGNETPVRPQGYPSSVPFFPAPSPSAPKDQLTSPSLHLHPWSRAQDPMTHCSNRPLTTDQYMTINSKPITWSVRLRSLIISFTFLSLNVSLSSWSVLNEWFMLLKNRACREVL